MNKLFIIILCSITFTLNLQGNPGEQSFKVNPGGTLSVHLSSSDIVINIWHRNEVFIRTPEDEDLIITNRNNTIRIEPGRGGISSNITLNIPAVFNIDINISAGDLKIKGDLRGNLIVNNSGGDIEFNNVSGKTNINTGGGDIRGTDVNGNVELKSSGGDIRIGSVKGRIYLLTGGGNISINNAQDVDLIKTSGGNIMMRNASGNGEISTGGGNIDIDKAKGNLTIFSNGGDIRINELSGRSNVKTGGGTIRMKKLNGSLNANTMAGDILVNFEKLSGTSKLISGNGNIRIGAAGNLRAKIVARTKDSDWWKDESGSNENIKSDFKASSLKRNKRNQEVETIYELNGGGPLVEIRTEYGDIIIRKNQIQ